MKSKLAIAIALWGWLLFVAWLSYDYVEYQDQMFVHIFQPPYSYEKTAFYVMIILAPFVYTVMGYLVNETTKLLKTATESEEKYRALSLVDELTNLCNRRGFYFLAEQQLKIADRIKKGILLLFADVDDLKWINDNLGHNVGDLALIDAANILKKTFRKSDIIARIGGDEFVVLALETPDAYAHILITRLQEHIKSHNAEGNRSFKLSISIGFAGYDPEHPCSIDELIAQADKYMYERKQSKHT
jgi:diguanylate cyclase (GGDEF)-like protein